MGVVDAIEVPERSYLFERGSFLFRVHLAHSGVASCRVAARRSMKVASLLGEGGTLVGVLDALILL